MLLQNTQKSNGSSFFTYFFAMALILFIVGCAYFLYNDREGPVITLSPEPQSVTSPNVIFKLNATDTQSGLKSVVVLVRRGSQSMELLNTTFTNKESEFNTDFTLERTRLPKGRFTLEVIAKDASYADFLQGNTTTLSYDLVMDNEPPRISVLSSAPSMRRGGSGLIAYQTSPDVIKTGIMIDNLFFPAFQNRKGEYLCLFPFPYFKTPTTFIPMIMAEDQAGNVTSSRLHVNLTNRIFPDDIVKITDSFLESKASEIRKILPLDLPLLELYIKVNNEVRDANFQTIIEVGEMTAPTFYWTENFQRQPRSAKRADFGDSRTYTYNGEKIDFQYHLGVDYASVAEDIVQSSNKGKVVYADYLGIYGNTVIVDHGRGLQTLYSHLTDMHVNVGDMVEKGHDLGTTGTTGLAVGDHVHFSFNIGGIPVQPAEWLDAKWVRNHITSRMN